MKKRYLKNWVENVLIFETMILIIFMAGDSEDLKIFILSKIVLLILLIRNYLIIKKWGRLYEF